jgi:hypothetical protein
MFILIFDLILLSQVLRKLWQKTHKTSVSRRYYYIDKRCTKMSAWKIIKEPNEKKTLVLYNISKDRNLGSLKNKRAINPN